ncbi:hypothetical protein SELR_05700 [Selenomonas ruminantium subsp. lactilytica TAM6421]|uniref:Uncharacterized protein n=1 Tax=Selenomonas ruminantium subsp. lactilytica (strain NBRC 103574 / TAM6421) TaxID=927704 RepID=I0GNE1_SELRL|nr:hypothetical protein [Selenomonas ruminantium]BAL82278.1 hypothetical protein SELR_05700 [Selenomonas ruminantium subsp. lactilytica TAM6421]
MVPEILGFLIIAGALLVLVVRYISQRRQGVDMEELQTSTEQLKAELTRSADAVIARMGNHIQHLEGLIRQADERNVRLEASLNEYKRLAGEMEERSATLNRELSEARRVIAELAAYQSVPLVPPASPIRSRQAAISARRRVDDQEFAAVLQNSLDRQEDMEQTPSLTSEPAINAQQAAGLAEAMNRKPEENEEKISPEPEEEEKKAPAEPREEKPISPNAAKAKALLRSGYSVEDTARETGMGRGAIELLREMNRRELDDKQR